MHLDVECQTAIFASGFIAHERPVESLSLSCNGIGMQGIDAFPGGERAQAPQSEQWLATAASDEVKLWRLHESCEFSSLDVRLRFMDS